jgi:hypothetical protein
LDKSSWQFGGFTIWAWRIAICRPSIWKAMAVADFRENFHQKLPETMIFTFF